MLVQTAKGLVDRSQLQVRDIIEEHENARVVATEWHLGDELVRRDVHVSVLRGHDIYSDQGKV